MHNIASIIMAAGRGSRMKGYDGNKTILPLTPESDIYTGSNPILLHIMDNLPTGPKTIIVNHRKADVIKATEHIDVTYCEQPELNGTGGALLAATDIINKVDCEYIIITMGDVPFVKKETYSKLIDSLSENTMTVLGFSPEDKKLYGVLEVNGNGVDKITEHKYWSKYTREKQESLKICNAGIYAAERKKLVKYLSVLSSRPQVIVKEVDGKEKEIKEYFITDLVEYMQKDGLNVGFVVSDDETELMGIDDEAALEKAQVLYKTT
jgi:bifunctional UDP-N-acetylglucosamine pyrophosphorylase/glucosamine-1-phosphate N-acetyltransferase